MTVKKAVTMAMAAAALASGVSISLAHYDSLVLRFVMLAWTVSPYAILWFLATRLKRRSTRLFWSGYAVIGLVTALAVYVAPRIVRSPWSGVWVMMTPGYLLNIGILGFLLFVLVRAIVSPQTPNQAPDPTAPSGRGSA